MEIFFMIYLSKEFIVSLSNIGLPKNHKPRICGTKMKSALTVEINSFWQNKKEGGMLKTRETAEPLSSTFHAST